LGGNRGENGCTRPRVYLCRGISGIGPASMSNYPKVLSQRPGGVVNVFNGRHTAEVWASAPSRCERSSAEAPEQPLLLPAQRLAVLALARHRGLWRRSPLRSQPGEGHLPSGGSDHGATVALVVSEFGLLSGPHHGLGDFHGGQCRSESAGTANLIPNPARRAMRRLERSKNEQPREASRP